MASTGTTGPNINQFMHDETLQFREQLIKKYIPEREKQRLQVYENMVECYHKHMTAEAVKQVDSQAMLDYYSCYKKVLRAMKDQNDKLYK